MKNKRPTLHDVVERKREQEKMEVSPTGYGYVPSGFDERRKEQDKKTE
ncbi:hypothetical protein [Alkalihalobacterium bogoriense]|nr:hypothetical protein [Alkalihalobacterium bogoriense]